MTQRLTERLELPMRGKQIVWTAAIALAVVVGFQQYSARKG